MVAPLRVGIAGLGTVGAEVVRLIEAQSRTLSERSGRGVKVVAVTARSKAKKRSLDLRGVELSRRRAQSERVPACACPVVSGMIGPLAGSRQSPPVYFA